MSECAFPCQLVKFAQVGDVSGTSSDFAIRRVSELKTDAEMQIFDQHADVHVGSNGLRCCGIVLILRWSTHSVLACLDNGQERNGVVRAIDRLNAQILVNFRCDFL